VVWTTCSQAVLNECGLILNQCGLEPILVLNQCGSETALFSTQRVYVLSSLQLADLPEEARSKVLQAAAPGKPFVRRAGRLKIKIVDSSLGERIAKFLSVRTFHGADS
jgi:hypothetical protein